MAVIILIIPIVWTIVKFLKEKKINWRYALWALAMIATALPMALYFLHNPQDFIGRAGGVSIFSQGNPIEGFVAGAVKTLGMFNFVGDYNWRHNFSGSPQLFWPVGIFFLIGLFVSVKELINKRLVYSLLITWFFVMLLPAVLTNEGLPHALRTIGVIPVCYIFAGLGAYKLYKFLYKFVESKKRNKVLLFIVCLLFLAICAYAQYDKYFIEWAKQAEVEEAFTKTYVDIGSYLNSLPLETARYVIVNQPGVLVNNIPMPAQTVMFIESLKFKVQSSKYLLPEEIDEIKSADKLVVIPLRYDEEIFRKLKEKFPQGEIKSQENFWLFEIKK
jgi:hypothetical protein